MRSTFLLFALLMTGPTGAAAQTVPPPAPAAPATTATESDARAALRRARRTLDYARQVNAWEFDHETYTGGLAVYGDAVEAHRRGAFDEAVALATRAADAGKAAATKSQPLDMQRFADAQLADETRSLIAAVGAVALNVPDVDAAGLRVSVDLLFEPGSAKLTPRGIEKIAALGEILLRHTLVQVTVEGYADVGAAKKDATNTSLLAQSRASAVIKAWKAQGIKSARLTGTTQRVARREQGVDLFLVPPEFAPAE